VSIRRDNRAESSGTLPRISANPDRWARWFASLASWWSRAVSPVAMVRTCSIPASPVLLGPLLLQNHGAREEVARVLGTILGSVVV